MQGRSIGSKRFNVGEAAPQPTRASIYQEENTPLEWTAAHDLRAQLALPQRPVEVHPRALRHGLIASQLGLPMLARAEKKHAPEAWEQAAAPAQAQAHAAYTGAAEDAGLDWSNNEQTTRYDEWELQKELVAYEQTHTGYDPTYDEHPRLDFQLPPVAAGYEDERDQRHELDYAQAAYAPAEYAEHDQGHASSPGSYPFAQMARHDAQPPAARWLTEQPIRRIAGVATHSAARAAEPRTATHGSFAPSVTGQPRTARSFGTTHRATASSTEPRIATQAGFATHAPLNAGFRGQAQVGPAQDTTNRRAAEPRAATQQGRSSQAHAGVAAHTLQPNASTRAGIAAHAQIAAHTPQTNAPTRAGIAAHTLRPNASTRAGIAAHAQISAPTPHTNAPTRTGLTTQTHAPNAGATRMQAQAQAAGTRSYAGAAGASVPRRAVRRYADDEPVVYPHGSSWLKPLVVLLALAGAGYAGHHYYFNYYNPAPMPVPAPPLPPPTAAAMPPAEPPAPPAPTIAPSEAQAAPTSPESAKERRSAARAALIAERWRERHAARRGRDDADYDDSGDARAESTGRGRAYARANDERESTSAQSRASTSASQRDDYADSEANRSSASADSDRDVSSDRIRSSASAHDDYVNDRHAAAQSGTLRINSLPWSQVHIDGQLVGHTPQMNLLLPAGKHRVTLVNNEMQLSKTLTVHIAPGNITTHTINLAE